MSMLKTVVFLAGVALIAAGARPLYTALTSAGPTTTSCAGFARDRPDNPWVRILDCEVDYLAAGYRESGGRIEELLLPARPKGQPPSEPAVLVAATRDAAALAIAQDVIGEGRQPDQEQFLVMMLKILTVLRASREIQGMTRSGPLSRLNARRALAGLTAPLAPGAAIIDLNARPDARWPSVAIVFGTALAGMALLWFRRARRPAESPAGQPLSAEQPAPAPHLRPSRGVRGLLLLNLQPWDGLHEIESAPPLGTREEVTRAVCAVAPGMTFDTAGRGELVAHDHRLTLDLGPHDTVHAAVAAAEGAAGLELLRTLLETERWRAYSPRAGVFVRAEELDQIPIPGTVPPPGHP
jgi:hypothetical protein